MNEQTFPEINETLQHIQGVIEALLFVNEKPVTLEQIKKVLETVTPSEIKENIARLEQEYAQRQSGIKIVEIAGGYQMLSNPTYAGYIRSFYKTKHKEKLSKPALETLAIIAYKQPVTRVDIELIRGVNSDGVVGHLLIKDLIKAIGRKDIPGRPFLYGTTRQFLEYFGLKSLDDLPKLEEFPTLVPPGEQGEEPAILPLEEGEEAAAVQEIQQSQEAQTPAAAGVREGEEQEQTQSAGVTTEERQSNEP